MVEGRYLEDEDGGGDDCFVGVFPRGAGAMVVRGVTFD